jgi:hypothetical protein
MIFLCATNRRVSGLGVWILRSLAGLVEVVVQDAKEEDRSQEESRESAGTTEGDFAEEVCGGSWQTCLQPADDMRLL